MTTVIKPKSTRRATDNPMRDIYERLSILGFKPAWVQKYILPDWWEDELAKVPATRAQIEVLLSRQLGLALAPLRNPQTPLCFESKVAVAFKHHQGVGEEKLKVASVLAVRVATLAGLAYRAPLKIQNWDAASIHKHILKGGAQWVGLQELLGFCWDIGVPVILLSQVPDGARRMDGLATWPGDRPVIVCSCRRKLAAWLLFIVAHELGHILLGHVPMGSGVFDFAVKTNDVHDEREILANRFALELLTGDPEFYYSGSWMKAETLARSAGADGPKLQIDPSVLALNYGHNVSRMGMGNKAAEILGSGEDATSVFRSFLQRLNTETLPDESLNVFEQLTDWETPMS